MMRGFIPDLPDQGDLTFAYFAVKRPALSIISRQNRDAGSQHLWPRICFPSLSERTSFIVVVHLRSKAERGTAMGRQKINAALLAVALLFFTQPFAHAQKVIRLGFSEGTDTPHGQTMTIFSKLVEQATHGRYQVRIFPNLQLGPVAQELQSVKLGTQEMFVSTPAWFSGFY